MYKFKDQQQVKFYNGAIKGTGKIVGVATNSFPILGNIFMIDVYTSDVVVPNDTYPFGVIVMAECHIEQIEEAPNKTTDYSL
jgi:hypothetical protein